MHASGAVHPMQQQKAKEVQKGCRKDVVSVW